jgi:hypothetical protein
MRLLSAAMILLTLVLCALSAGCPRVGSCEAQDTHGFSTSCSGPAGYVWTGSSCIYTRSCNCTGDDCGTMYQSQEICESTHTHCAP